MAKRDFSQHWLRFGCDIVGYSLQFHRQTTTFRSKSLDLQGSTLTFGQTLTEQQGGWNQSYECNERVLQDCVESTR